MLSFLNLHNAVTWTEASCKRSLDEIDMCPLHAMVVDVIRDFTQ